MPNGPSTTHAGESPRKANAVGSNCTQHHVAKPARMPATPARGGVCGRQIANASAGTNVASAENDTAPTSASASLPATRRL